MKMFRDLNTDEQASFRAWARDNYKPFSPIDGSWHPVIQGECAKMNAEKGADVSLDELLNG